MRVLEKAIKILEIYRKGIVKKAIQDLGNNDNDNNNNSNDNSEDSKSNNNGH